MEMIRSSAFGKLVRLLSRRRLLKYPEETDPSTWKAYVKPEAEAKAEEEKAIEEVPDAFGLYTVISQASRVGRTLSTPGGLERAETSKSKRAIQTDGVVSWRDADDTEVGALITLPLSVYLFGCLEPFSTPAMPSGCPP